MCPAARYACFPAGHAGPALQDSSTAALTGLGVCAPIIFVISAFAALVFFGSSARASISMGAGDYEGAERIMGGCFTLLIAVALAVTAAESPLL